jgi:putative ATP-binding cassette transporter
MIVGAIFVGAVSGLSSVGLLALIGTALRDATRSPGWRLGWAFVGLCLLVTVTRIGSAYLLEQLGQGLARDVRLDLVRRILATPLPRLEELGPPRLLAALTHDVESLTQSLVLVPLLCINATIVAGCLAYLGWLNRGLFLVLLVVTVLGAVGYQIPARLGVRRFRQARDCQTSLFGHFEELSSGIKELKLHHRRRRTFVDLVRGTAERMRRLMIRSALIFNSASAGGHLLFFVVIGVLIFVRGALPGAEPGDLVAYAVTVLYMMTPLQQLLDSYPALGRGEVAVEKLASLGFSLADGDGAAVEEGADGDGAPTAPPWRRLELEGVTHRYRTDRRDHSFVLGPIDLTLEPGELVFVVGGNGSGKTTLAKVLTGLYRPESGCLRLDGEPVGDGDADRYRELYATVFSDFHLFEQLLGLEGEAREERAREYLEELQIDHKVTVEGGRWSTLELSTGQRKRLALVVALLEDRPIYLFDEWAADQDPVFKEVFYHGILAELRRRGKLALVISHDDRYFHLADRILRLEEGKLVYDGFYDGLVRSARVPPASPSEP